jgi:hypothetical protein
MKKLAKRVSIFMLALTLSTFSYAATETNTAPIAKSEPLTEVEAKKLASRLDEIDAIDKSDMERGEKKALRKEVKEIKRELKGNGGIYLSTGALIIIILLLIILL